VKSKHCLGCGRWTSQPKSVGRPRLRCPDCAEFEARMQCRESHYRRVHGMSHVEARQYARSWP
jgi:hypothetical protein